MELIAQNNQNKNDYEIIDEPQYSKQNSQSFQQTIKQPNRRIKEPFELQKQQKNELQQELENDIAHLDQKRYTSIKINQFTQQINNQQLNQNNQINESTINDVLNKFQVNSKNYALRTAAYNQGAQVHINNNTVNYGELDVNQSVGSNQQQSQLKTLPLRSQVQYQSGLSSSQSLTIQRDFHIYFHIPEYNTISRNTSSNNQSYDIDEESITKNQENCETVKVPIDDLHEEATVQDALLSAICLINNNFSLQKLNIRLAYDENLYDLYLANKNGEKKSLPALYPLEKIKKFIQSNLVLKFRDITAIITQKENNAQTVKDKNNSFSSKEKGIENDQKTSQLRYREIIKEVNESMISLDLNQNNIQSGSNSFIKQKVTSSFLVNQQNSNIHKCIQTTITPNQTKIVKKEKESGDIQLSPHSQCFSFFCFKRSKNKKNSIANNIVKSQNVSKNNYAIVQK